MSQTAEVDSFYLFFYPILIWRQAGLNIFYILSTVKRKNKQRLIEAQRHWNSKLDHIS